MYQLLNEHKLILLVTKSDSSEQEIEQIREILQGPLNWKEVMGQIYAHRLYGIFHSNLFRYGISREKTFKEIRQSLRVSRIANEQKNLEEIKIVEELSKALNDAEVPYVIVKGSIMANCVYRDLGARTSNDIDLLIHPQSSKKITQVLTDLGYIQGWFDPHTKVITPATRAEIIFTRKHTHELYPFVKLIDGVYQDFSILDINYSMEFGQGGTDQELVEELLEKRVPVQIGEETSYSLAWEDLLLHLCLHTAREARGIYWIKAMTDHQLYKFCDIHYAVKNLPVDWDLFLQQTFARKLAREVYASLYQVELLYPGTVDSMRLKHLRDEAGDLSYLDQYSDSRELIQTWDVPFPARAFDFDRVKRLPENLGAYEEYLKAYETFSKN